LQLYKTEPDWQSEGRSSAVQSPPFVVQLRMDRKRKLEVDTVAVNALSQPQKGLNPYTGRPYSNKYYDILSKRKGITEAPPCLYHMK
jgi:hypothetical protein